MNKYDKQHINNVRRYQRKIDKIYKTAAEEIAQRAVGLPAPDDDIFSLDDHPRTMEAINALMDDMRKQITFTVTDGVKAEWDLSNAKNDDMVDDVLAGRAKVAETVRWYRTNIEARDAFLTRVENGMRLSDRVWNYTNQFKQEIELGLDCGIRDGLDAPAMARQLKQYLKYPDKLFRRVRDEHGILRLSKRAAAFHPGRGVYRSSYKNARRLAATETNMAYRQADYDRWQQLEMVVGVEIRLSNNHTCLNNKGKAVAFYDICDELKGKYPKDFKFVGWHPHCRCIMTPIKKSREEIDADIDRLLNGQPALPSEASENYVKDMPEGWDKWMDKNQDRLERAKSMPYFIRDNFKDGDPSQGLKWMVEKPLTPAEIRHAARTPEYEKAIRAARAKEIEEMKWIQRGAENMLKVAADYGESDVAALQKAMQLGEMNAVKKQTKALAQQLLDIRAQEKALADLIPDVHMWHQQFTMAELKKAHSAVLDKLTDIAPWSLEAQKKALEKEIKYVADPTFMKPHSLHPTWKVAQDAYARQLSDVLYKIETKKISQELAPIEQWLAEHPKASKVASLVQDVKDAIAAGEELTSINDKMLLAKLDYKKRIAAQAYRDRQKLKTATGGPITLPDVSRAEANRLIAEFEKEYGDSADDMLRKMTEADWKRFAKEHKVVLTKYTQTYSYLNEPMREIRYCAGRTKKEFDHDMPLLTEALSMQRAPKNMVVRRGVSDYPIKALGKDLSDLQPGDEFVDGGFLSTAVRVDKGFFEEYNLVIVVPKGAQGVYAEPFTHYNGGSFNYTGELWNGTSKESFGCEREWIGQRGSKFRVLKKSGDTIYLQMIGQLHNQTTDYGLYIR